jgi:hypothetical protein
VILREQAALARARRPAVRGHELEVGTPEAAAGTV